MHKVYKNQRAQVRTGDSVVVTTPAREEAVTGAGAKTHPAPEGRRTAAIRCQLLPQPVLTAQRRPGSLPAAGCAGGKNPEDTKPAQPERDLSQGT